ncbi:MAG: WYL domain-containing protein [Actinomycetes bacterium]
MSATRTERLLNLVICLLASRQFLSREQIRQAVPQYARSDSDEAFERMFERDKDDLRELGIPLVTGSNSAWFEDEIGYRIPQDEYALPAITFAPDELAVLALAARAWQQATLAKAASTAVRKLEAGGVSVDPSGLAVVEPRVTAAEPAFAALFEAVRDRRPVRFDYRRSGAPAPQTRELEPWGVVSWHGRWYVVGRDVAKGASRVFRLSRIAGPVTFTGARGSVEVPDDIDVRHEVTMLAPDGTAHRASVLVRDGAAHPLRRRGDLAVSSPSSRSSRSSRDGWDTVSVGYTDAETLAIELCGYGADVVVLEPAELRDAVIRRLTAVARAS